MTQVLVTITIPDRFSTQPALFLRTSILYHDLRTTRHLLGFQDPADAAAAFCVENLDPSSHSEVFTRCSQTLSSSIVERASATNFGPNHDAQTVGQQQQQQQQQQQRQNQEAQGQANMNGREGEGDVGPSMKPLLTVPLNINGVETTLQMYEGSGPEGVAEEFCNREEFAFVGQSLSSCYSQVGPCVLCYYSTIAQRELQR